MAADIEADIRTLLLEVAAITTLVPPRVIGAVSYPGIFAGFAVKQFAPPYLVVTERETDPMPCLDGTYGMQMSVIEITINSYSRQSARTISRAVTSYFKDFSGAAGESTILQVLLLNTTVDNTIADGSDERIHTVTLTCDVQHHPT